MSAVTIDQRTPLWEQVADQRPQSLNHDAPRRGVLVLEDNDLARKQLQKLLESDPRLEIESVGDAETALELLNANSYSLLITDLRLPRGDGMDVLRAVQQRRLPVTVIVMTGHGSINEAVEAIRMGAYDFLTKPLDIKHLRVVIERALRDRALQDELAQLRSQLQRQHGFHGVVSRNPHMHAMFELINHVAHTNSTVLIEGETGTGKEQVAQVIHNVSTQRTGPMVAVNCAALPESLLESELFGHEKGAFTNAVGQRRGRFEMATGGTIFLDEIGDVPMPMQAKLLRVLQERRFERIGGSESIEVDVRVITATNRALPQLVRQGTFREDLYYRLNVVKIDLPPLRDRPEDIPLLTQHFIEKYCRTGEPPKRIAPQAMEVLLNAAWPGNIRQLENAIERACVTCRGDTIERSNLPADLIAPSASRFVGNVSLDRPLPEVLREMTVNVEQAYLRKALRKAHGNVGRCAKICGMSRRSITAKLGEYQFDKAAFKEL